MSLNFAPNIGGYMPQSPFRFWCQKVLPTVYEDSLSYYELLCKVVDALNHQIELTNQMGGDITALANAVNALEQYITNLDISDAINEKLDQMATNGELASVVFTWCGYVTPQMMGAACDGSTNDYAKLRETFQYAYNNNLDVYFPPGEYSISSGIDFATIPISDTNPERIGLVNIYMDGVIIYRAEGTALKLSRKSSDGINRVFKLRVTRPNTETQDHQSVGIEINGVSMSNIDIIESTFFDYAFILHADLASCLLNNITLNDIRGNSRGVLLKNGANTCNGNNIYGGYIRMSWAHGTREVYGIEIQGNENVVSGAYIEGGTIGGNDNFWTAGVLFSGSATANYIECSQERIEESGQRIIASKSIDTSKCNVVKLYKPASGLAVNTSTYAAFPVNSKWLDNCWNVFSQKCVSFRPIETVCAGYTGVGTAGEKVNVAFSDCEFIATLTGAITSKKSAATEALSGMVTVNGEYVTINKSGTPLPCICLDATKAKNFFVVSDTAGGTIRVAVYDSNDTQLGDGYLKLPIKWGLTDTWDTNYGGCYRIEKNSPTGFLPFSVDSSVAKIRIIIPNAQPISYLDVYTTPMESTAIISPNYKPDYAPENSARIGAVRVTTTGTYIYNGTTWDKVTFDT